MKAVIKIGSTQFLVEPGDEIVVNKIHSPQKSMVFDQVLLLIDETDIKVGQPLVAGVTAKASYLGDISGPKIRVAKYKAKSRYRREIGFRSRLSRLKIDSIDTGTEIKTAPPKTASKTKGRKSV